MGEHDAVESLERLGLSSYEAKVFIALQKLGVGTARDVARIADVPRSQVYSTAESLGDRGLIDVQQSSPIQYRPLPIDEARERLRDRFESESERAFDYIDEVRSETPVAEEEETEDVWTITGRETIDNRLVSLLRDASERVVLGVKHESLLTEAIDATLREAADRGVTVTVISENPAVRERFDDRDDVATVEPAIREGPEGSSGRILVVDGETILLSVIGDDELPDVSRETAIWSAKTNFARVFVRLVEGFFNPS